MIGSVICVPKILTRTLYQQLIHTPWKWLPSPQLPTEASGYVFQRLKNVKSKTRTQITNTHLENSLRIATSPIKADIIIIIINVLSAIG